MPRHDLLQPSYVTFFFFNDTATTEIYTLSLHDALPILRIPHLGPGIAWQPALVPATLGSTTPSCAPDFGRSEEHTSELQSRSDLVCRLLLEKKQAQAPYSVAAD